MSLMSGSFIKLSIKKNYRKPALETLAIIAYKQPVTRGDVELIRGVNSDGVVSSFAEQRAYQNDRKKGHSWDGRFCMGRLSSS